MIRNARPVARCILAVAGATTLLAAGQTPSLTYPQARKGADVDDYFGTKVADPYRWMEDRNAPEVKQWVGVENAVTFKYLESLPAREQFRRRITELWDYPKISAPYYKGGRWFYSRNSGLQRQGVVYARASLTSAEAVGARSECAVARRIDRAVRIGAVARRPTLRLGPI